MQPIVLLYNLDDSTTLGRQVRRLCAVQKLRCRGVLPAQQGWPLSALLGGQTPAGQPAAAGRTRLRRIRAGGAELPQPHSRLCRARHSGRCDV